MLATTSGRSFEHNVYVSDDASCPCCSIYVRKSPAWSLTWMQQLLRFVPLHSHNLDAVESRYRAQQNPVGSMLRHSKFKLDAFECGVRDGVPVRSSTRVVVCLGRS